jgi:F-type H+-transporting ATPase subunit delta
MIGASRESLTAVQESLRSRTGQGDLSALSGQLLAVADVVAREKSLRLMLADGGQPVAARTGLIADVLGSHVDATTGEVVATVVSRRWSSDSDLIDALEILGAQAAFITADANGTLDRAENDIFHFGRVVDASAELQMTLTDPSVASDAKTSIVSDLLKGKVEAQTANVIAYFASHLRGRRVDAVIELLSDLAAAQRNQVVAEVRSVVALDESQITRLATALTKLTGKQVSINVAIDPTVIGGISVKIGQDVIDGSVATRLESARRSLLA